MNIIITGFDCDCVDVTMTNDKYKKYIRNTTTLHFAVELNDGMELSGKYTIPFAEGMTFEQMEQKIIEPLS